MASVLKVDKLDPQSGTALEIGTSGDTVSLPSGATLDISASTLTPPATMPASSGINLTALNASNLGSGTVPAARLSGVGKVLQILMLESGGSNTTIDSTSMQRPIDSGYYLDITPTTSGNKIICLGGMDTNTENMGVYYCIEFCVSTDGGSNWGDITNTQRAYMYLTGATRMEHNHNFLSGTHTTANTNVHRFSYQALSGVDSTQFYPNQRTSITLIEVAQ